MKNLGCSTNNATAFFVVSLFFTEDNGIQSMSFTKYEYGYEAFVIMLDYLSLNFFRIA